MASKSPSQIIDTARTYESIGSILKYGLGGAILAVFLEAISLFQAIIGVLLYPLQALGLNVAGIVDSFIGGIATIIGQGVETTVLALAPGAYWAVGPLTFGFSIAAAAGGIFVMSWLLSLSPTSDLLPGTFTDVPFLGVDEDEEQIPQED